MPPATQPALTPIIGPTFTVVREGGGEPLLAALSPDGTQAVVWEAHTAVSMWAVLPVVLAWVCFAALLGGGLVMLIRIGIRWRRLARRSLGALYCDQCGYQNDAQAFADSGLCSECGSSKVLSHIYFCWVWEGELRALFFLLLLGALSIGLGGVSDVAKGSTRGASVTLWRTIQSLGIQSWGWRPYRVAELAVYDIDTGRREHRLELPGRYRTFDNGWSRQASQATPVDLLIWNKQGVISLSRRFDPQRRGSDWVIERWPAQSTALLQIRTVPIVRPDQLPTVSELTDSEPAWNVSIRLISFSAGVEVSLTYFEDDQPFLLIRGGLVWLNIRHEQLIAMTSTERRRMIDTDGLLLHVYDAP
jgi:hypothetical protein